MFEANKLSGPHGSWRWNTLGMICCLPLKCTKGFWIAKLRQFWRLVPALGSNRRNNLGKATLTWELGRSLLRIKKQNMVWYVISLCKKMSGYDSIWCGFWLAIYVSHITSLHESSEIVTLSDLSNAADFSDYRKINESQERRKDLASKGSSKTVPWEPIRSGETHEGDLPTHTPTVGFLHAQHCQCMRHIVTSFYQRHCHMVNFSLNLTYIHSLTL